MTRSRLRLVFAGTPAAAVPSLRALAASDHELAAVVTRPDAPLGRKRVLTPSPVARAAAELGLPLIRAARLDAEASASITALQPDLGVIVAYGALVREPLLSAPRLGWINLHFSLLPRWRGAAPVQHAILAGDEWTGASVFALVPELDAGAVFAESRRRIGEEETAGELLGSLAVSGASLLVSTVDELAAGRARATPQSGVATYAGKLVREDGRIRFDEGARAVSARIRGVTPEPGAFAEIGGATLKILRARIPEDTFGGGPGDEPRGGGGGVTASASGRHPGEVFWDGRRVLVGTASEPIELVTVQPAGKRPMDAADWWRGLAERDGLVAR